VDSTTSKPPRATICPQCGAPLTSAGTLRGIPCTYCGAIIEQDTGREDQLLCACGRLAEGECLGCRAPLCEHHALTVVQFDLHGILHSSGLSLDVKEAQQWASQLVTTMGKDSIYCGPCFDGAIEKWISAVKAARPGG
jgi:hypothetical protein